MECAGKRKWSVPAAMLGLVVAILMASVSSGAAQVARTQGDWKVGPQASPEGQFLYCRTENQYSGGLVLGVVRNAKDEFVLIVASPRANLQPGTVVDATLSIDGGNRRQVKGRVNNPNIAEFVLGRDEAFYNALMRGSVLRVNGGSLDASFGLSGTMNALTRVRTCIAQSTGRAPAAAAPRRQASAAAGSAPAAVGGALPASIERVLRATGMVATVGLGNGQQQVLGFGPVVGLVQQIGGGGSLRSLSDRFFEQAREACPQSFSSDVGDVVSIGGTEILSGKLECDQGDVKVYGGTIFYRPGGENTTYLFRFSGPADEAQLLEGRRDTMVDVLRKLASG